MKATPKFPSSEFEILRPLDPAAYNEPLPEPVAPQDVDEEFNLNAPGRLRVVTEEEVRQLARDSAQRLRKAFEEEV